jgi:hypothetical protein
MSPTFHRYVPHNIKMLFFSEFNWKGNATVLKYLLKGDQLFQSSHPEWNMYIFVFSYLQGL